MPWLKILCQINGTICHDMHNNYIVKRWLLKISTLCWIFVSSRMSALSSINGQWQIRTSAAATLFIFLILIFSWILALHPNMWPGLRKSTMWTQENRRFFPSLLYHNVRTICTNNLKSLSLLLNLMGFLLKFTEMKCHIQNWRYKQKYNSECNLRWHGWFL